MEPNKDVVIDFPKIIQKFMDNRDNRRNYSNESGDYENDPIIFKQKTKFKDKNGKYIFEWDYVLVDDKKCLITVNGGAWEYTNPHGYSGWLLHKESKDLEIISQKEFNGKIVIKGINILERNITNMSIWASAIIDKYLNIRRGIK